MASTLRYLTVPDSKHTILTWPWRAPRDVLVQSDASLCTRRSEVSRQPVTLAPSPVRKLAEPVTWLTSFFIESAGPVCDVLDLRYQKQAVQRQPGGGGADGRSRSGPAPYNARLTGRQGPSWDVRASHRAQAQVALLTSDSFSALLSYCR